MALERYRAEVGHLDPGDGAVETAEPVVEDDVLVKTFALGPGGELDSHEHPQRTNGFHVLDTVGCKFVEESATPGWRISPSSHSRQYEGTVTVLQGERRERVDAPGVVAHERGVAHGARNDTDQPAVFTGSLRPLPS